jgi:dipeptidyl aminopeptidase/acylaminoacyl peptidase
VRAASTGVEREVARPAPAGVTPLAFSADGRQLAYATVDGRLDPIVSDTVRDEASRSGVLSVLDLATGETAMLPAVTPVVAAAFGPDGRLAVQTGPTTIWVGTTDGSRTATMTVPDDHRLVDGVAWSPDGRLLALTGSTSTYLGDDMYEVRPHVAFADATGAAGPVPEPVPAEEMLGWRSPDRIVARTAVTPPGEISEIPLGGGPARVLGRFPPGNGCEYRSHPCLAVDVRMASGRLADLVVRPAGRADRGPWPAWFVLVLAGGAVGGLLIGAALVSAVRRRPT